MNQEITMNIPPPPLQPPSIEIEEVEMNSRTGINDPSTSSPRQPQEGRQPAGRDLLENREHYFSFCVPLYGASITGNQEAAEVILGIHPGSLGFPITESYDTALHVAASAEETKLTERFVDYLVLRMDRADLELRNKNGNTALCLAAAAGNTNMARIMVDSNPNLVNIPGAQGMMPLYMSALHGKYGTVKYLYSASGDMHAAFWTDRNRRLILLRCVEYDFFDVALRIVIDHPQLNANGYVLGALARKPHAFNGVKENLLTRIIYSIFRIIHMKARHTREDTDALRLLTMIWAHTIKKMPKSAIHEMLRGPPDPIPRGGPTNEGHTYSSRILFVAAEMGNTNFVIELIRANPDIIWNTNDDGRTIFHIAVMHRHQGIYNLLYEIGSRKDQITFLSDTDGNNMLHLVGMTSKTTKTSRASLLMQQELLWFKEVEKMIPPAYRETKNKVGQTPYEIFSAKNHNLVAESLKWVKDCMVVAALIVTIAFAVAFTVPGGYNQNNGLPVFIHEPSFIVFVLADAISLFSSTTSLLVYLSILAARYEQYDSLLLLTRKLMIGLLTLFISVAAMMVTFSASFFVLYHNGLKWVPILIGTFAVMPMIAFARLQYRLLVDMFPSMCNSMFQFNPRKRTLYNMF